MSRQASEMFEKLDIERSGSISLRNLQDFLVACGVPADEVPEKAEILSKLNQPFRPWGWI